MLHYKTLVGLDDLTRDLGEKHKQESLKAFDEDKRGTQKESSKDDLAHGEEGEEWLKSKRIYPYSS